MSFENTRPNDANEFRILSPDEQAVQRFQQLRERVRTLLDKKESAPSNNPSEVDRVFEGIVRELEQDGYDRKEINRAYKIEMREREKQTEDKDSRTKNSTTEGILPDISGALH